MMGQQRFLQVVRHENQGSAAGQDTGEPMEHGESEQGGSDVEELNHALAHEHFRDAAELQQLVLLVLENINAGNMSRVPERNNVLREVSNRLESMAPRHQMLTPALADRFLML